MDTVVYPDKSVAEIIGRSFVPVKVKILEAQDVAKKWGVEWTPTFLFLDASGDVRHRAVGYLPPKDFAAHCLYALARAQFSRQSYKQAKESFTKVAKEYRETEPAAAAQYWAGVCDYKASGSPEGLKTIWKTLQKEHPTSEWARKASFIK